MHRNIITYSLLLQSCSNYIHDSLGYCDRNCLVFFTIPGSRVTKPRLSQLLRSQLNWGSQFEESEQQPNHHLAHVNRNTERYEMGWDGTGQYEPHPRWVVSLPFKITVHCTSVRGFLVPSWLDPYPCLLLFLLVLRSCYVRSNCFCL